MSMHTPGPWTISYDDKHWQQRISANDAPIAVTKDQANARLIAAAPDLLAACKATVGVFEGFEDVPLYVRKARAAIAKAEGAS